MLDFLQRIVFAAAFLSASFTKIYLSKATNPSTLTIPYEMLFFLPYK